MGSTAPEDGRRVLSGQAMDVNAEEEPIATQRVLCGDAADSAGVRAMGVHWLAFFSFQPQSTAEHAGQTMTCWLPERSRKAGRLGFGFLQREEVRCSCTVLSTLG